MKQMWEERYSEEGFAYGEQANEYFKTKIDQLEAGKLLLPAEGEGRNAVYAASKGWQVHAFDQSENAQKKAHLLAQKHQVNIDYRVENIHHIKYQPENYDALALIYAHFPPEHRENFHRKLGSYLKPGGWVIIEGFSKNNLALSQGQAASNGPKNLGMLFSTEEIASDFDGFDILELEEKNIQLNEGKYHQGEVSVIRLLARKQ